MTGRTFGWVPVRPGDVFHVPGDEKHAWRNPSEDEAAVTIIVSTARIGSFFRELGTPVARPPAVARQPSEATIERFLEIADRHGYWNATPEENAAIGLRLG